MPYIVKPRRQRTRSEDYEWWELESTQPTNITVHEDDGVQYTGLLDSHGNELCRVPERIKMGFVK